MTSLYRKTIMRKVLMANALQFNNWYEQTQKIFNTHVKCKIFKAKYIWNLSQLVTGQSDFVNLWSEHHDSFSVLLHGFSSTHTVIYSKS